MLGKAENFIDYCLSQLFREIKSVYAPCQPPCYYKQCNMVTNVQLSKDKDVYTVLDSCVCRVLDNGSPCHVVLSRPRVNNCRYQFFASNFLMRGKITTVCSSGGGEGGL